MKAAKIAISLVIALASSAALAQIKGVPASVTSIRSNGVAHGVPASVTSLGPNGLRGGYGNRAPIGCPMAGLIPSAMGCTNPLFTPSINYTTGQVQFGDVNVRGRHRRPHGGWAGPVYYPYPVYAYPYYDTADYTDAVQQPVEPPQTAQPVQIQVQIEDKRPVAEPAPVAAEQAPPAKAPAIASEPVEQGPATVLVFRDGHQQEVRNYAIVGKTLYDLGTFVAHKIPLAELDLDQTVKANEDRGVEFTLPAGYKMD